MPIRQQFAEDFRKKSDTIEFWLHLLLYTCLGLSLWPITQWVAATAQEQSRIFHAFIVLGLATLFLVRFGGVQVVQTLSMNRSARRSLTAAYVLLAINFLARQLLYSSSPTALQLGISLLHIPAYCIAVASLSLFIFGEKIRRIVLTVGSTLCAFLLLSTLMQPLDWPLRGLAGKWSQTLLELLGQNTALNIVNGEQDIPVLILLVNDYPFQVASECNGFGVILSSILLSVMLTLYRRLNIFDSAMNLLAGLTLGFLFNILRIIVIILLAPHMMQYYMLMHEIVGGITYWACLILIWCILNGPVREESASAIMRH
ncbi:MAG: archaeosortase/exosortase family protein [Coraliomargaritaceae bacterium]